jgi:hypothetical protein
LRKAAQVLGANCSSKRAWNVKSPAWTMSWLIQDARDVFEGCYEEIECGPNLWEQGTFQADS